MEKNGPRNRDVCHHRRRRQRERGFVWFSYLRLRMRWGEWQSWIQWQAQGPSNSSLFTLPPLPLNQTNGCKYNNLSFGTAESKLVTLTTSAGKAFLGRIQLHSQWTLFAVSAWGERQKSVAHSKCLFHLASVDAQSTALNQR